MVGQTKVFVGSLPQGSKPEELRKLFERFGVVTECDIMNRCGFVHMQTEEQASAAIRDLHNSTFNGALITVERGRIKERGGPRGGGRGGMRGGMRGLDRRGGMRAGPPRDAPYPPVRDRGMGGPMRGPPMGGMSMRNGGSYDRSMDRSPMGGGSYDDRYNGYGGEDRRGFALMDSRGARDPYAVPPPMYPDDRRSYAAPVDDMAAMYPDERRAPMYPDERDMMDRRPMSSAYDRAPPRVAPVGNGDIYSRRAEPSMRASNGATSGYDRDPYAQQYPPMGRGVLSVVTTCGRCCGATGGDARRKRQACETACFCVAAAARRGATSGHASTERSPPTGADTVRSDALRRGRVLRVPSIATNENGHDRSSALV
ncbi:jg12930 [Pararge aegeria aegeria]|uniref:Jg12930 protein n=1 Tax=Pararge aegeria aegeria TaxID=348720 RepID=A0A8S4SMB7_9NEOP|nr:jg12930 [Pararge aegeria aegeria]